MQITKWTEFSNERLLFLLFFSQIEGQSRTPAGVAHGSLFGKDFAQQASGTDKYMFELVWIVSWITHDVCQL